MQTRFLMLLFSLSAAWLPAQNLDKAKLDSLFSILEKNNQAMGSLAISQKEQIIYQQSAGWADQSQGLKNNAQTKFRIGSITKTFTAVLVMQLVEEKKLSLNTKLSKFFPKIANSKKISIAHLLQHRSGIHNFTDDANYPELAPQAKTQAEMLELIAALPSDFQPDKKAAYSNSNYVLLGFIVENICKKPYSQLIKERICDKIGLKNTYYGGKIATNNQEANSYAYTNNQWLPMTETDMSIPHAAGALVSTPAELNQFIEALFAGKLLSEASLKQMKTLKDGFGLGLFQFPFGSKKAWGHTGGIDGFGSMLAYFEEEKAAFAYCSNGEVYPTNDIMLAALSVYFGQKYQLPDFTEIALPEGLLEACAGAYSSKTLPLGIKLFAESGKLYAQADGQSSFPLLYKGENLFVFDAAGIKIKIDADRKGFHFQQGRQSHIYTKQ